MPNISYALLVLIILTSSACGTDSTGDDPTNTNTTSGLLVTSHTPSLNEVDVSLNSTISILFNSTLDESTISPSSIVLQDQNGAINSSVSHSNGTVTITPSSILDPSTVYTVTLQTTLENIDNEPLPTAYAWSFITGINTQPTAGLCDPLLPASGNIITANSSQASTLGTLVSSLNAGDTLLLEDGTYNLNGVSLRFNTPGVTLMKHQHNLRACSYQSYSFIE